MNLQDCLPLELHGPNTTITRIAAGLSGAAVHRVEADGRTFVLKVANDAEPASEWRRKVRVQQLAAEAGLAPPVIHVDEARRAVVSAFVIDRSFPRFFFDPRTRDAALVKLGQTIRRIHALPLASDATANDPRALLASIWSGLEPSFRVPGFVADAIRRVLTEEPPASERALVLSHNDVNPTNLVYDGETLLLLDWDVSGPNDPFYDLAAISVFLRMDEATCQALLAAYDGSAGSAITPRFRYCQRLVAVLCGATFLQLARTNGHAGASDTDTLETTLPLSQVYERLRSGAVSVASADGQWAMGLALVKASAAYSL